ncbi:hypothetical protein CN1A_13 [Clavibacter phage CN1A]|uniref:Uncharacterized protein n=1 Tax=Clavibacter phage CN1A TaxID=1406793 RepID=U5PX15_9CAUD|nr:hypothetical protein CN1A_13 [Clavibacter phage CN1A]AGY47122.1 hypothetical protein CN1A_13 [Clavibacter phage CN1A]
MSAVDQAIEFELIREPVATRRDSEGAWKTDKVRLAHLVARDKANPPQYDNMRGKSYQDVSNYASRMNKIQLDRGMMDYMFAPETVPIRRGE